MTLPPLTGHSGQGWASALTLPLSAEVLSLECDGLSLSQPRPCLCLPSHLALGYCNCTLIHPQSPLPSSQQGPLLVSSSPFSFPSLVIKSQVFVSYMANDLKTFSSFSGGKKWLYNWVLLEDMSRSLLKMERLHSVSSLLYFADWRSIDMMAGALAAILGHVGNGLSQLKGWPLGSVSVTKYCVLFSAKMDV